jgi:DNA invertase Pin-like site-specific DNA recombinase
MELPCQYYTEEFKQEAVKLIRESGLKLSEAANRLNIPSQTLKNWLYREKNTSHCDFQKTFILGLCHKVHGLKPFGQGQLSGVEYRP